MPSVRHGVNVLHLGAEDPVLAGEPDALQVELDDRLAALRRRDVSWAEI